MDANRGPAEVSLSLDQSGLDTLAGWGVTVRRSDEFGSASPTIWKLGIAAENFRELS